MSYDNEMKGVLFNSMADKRAGKKDPDYKGSATIEGTEYWLSAWIDVAKDGRKYMSLRFNPKEAKAAKPARPTNDDEFGDSIPF